MADSVSRTTNELSSAALPRKPSTPTYLYGIQADQYLKVGMTTELSYRVVAIQTNCPIEATVIAKLKNGSRAKEKDAHRILRDFRVRDVKCEWFEPPKSVFLIFDAAKDSDELLRLLREEIGSAAQ